MAHYRCKTIERCGSCLGLVLCSLMLMLVGCDAFDPLAPAYYRPDYTVRFEIFPQDADVPGVYDSVNRAESYINRHGTLVPFSCGGGIYSTAPSRIPDHVIMKWTSPSNLPMEQEITLTGIVPDMSHFKGTIWFLYHHGHWTVKPVTEGEAIQRAIHGSSTAPFDKVR